MKVICIVGDGANKSRTCNSSLLSRRPCYLISFVFLQRCCYVITQQSKVNQAISFKSVTYYSFKIITYVVAKIMRYQLRYYFGAKPRPKIKLAIPSKLRRFLRLMKFLQSLLSSLVTRYFINLFSRYESNR